MRALLFFFPALLFAQVIVLPPAIVRRPYAAGPLSATAVHGCTIPIPAYRLIDGELPPGLSHKGGGLLRGSAERTGAYRFTFFIDNGCGGLRQPFLIPVRGAAVLTASPDSLEITLAKTDSQSPTQAIRPHALLAVASDWPALDYTASASAPWLRLHPLRGRTSFPGEALASDSLAVDLDIDRLDPGQHRTEIRLTSHSAVAPVLIPVIVTVVR